MSVVYVQEGRHLHVLLKLLAAPESMMRYDHSSERKQPVLLILTRTNRVHDLLNQRTFRLQETCYRIDNKAFYNKIQKTECR